MEAQTSLLQLLPFVYKDAYEPNLEGMGDLIMADFTGRIIGVAGGDAYQIEVKSPTNVS